MAILDSDFVSSSGQTNFHTEQSNDLHGKIPYSDVEKKHKIVTRPVVFDLAGDSGSSKRPYRKGS